jgi:hypothetical protein
MARLYFGEGVESFLDFVEELQSPIPLENRFSSPQEVLDDLVKARADALRTLRDGGAVMLEQWAWAADRRQFDCASQRYPEGLVTSLLFAAVEDWGSDKSLEVVQLVEMSTGEAFAEYGYVSEKVLRGLSWEEGPLPL